MASFAVSRSYNPCQFCLVLLDQRKTYLMVVFQEFVEKVNGLVTDKSLILRVDKAVPWLLLESSQDIVVLCVELDFIFVQIIKEVVGAENLGNLDELIRVAVAVEEGLLAEDHGCEHGTKTPHVQTVVVLLEIN